MTYEMTKQILGSAERAALLSLSVYEHLTGDAPLTPDAAHTLAREVWVFHLEATQSARTMGEALGVEVELE